MSILLELIQNLRPSQVDFSIFDAESSGLPASSFVKLTPQSTLPMGLAPQFSRYIQYLSWDGIVFDGSRITCKTRLEKLITADVETYIVSPNRLTM